jgi:hypothetical protein
MSAIPAAVVRYIKSRDGEMCLKCGSRRATDSHHRMRRRDGEHSVSNLVRLCRVCHAFVHDNPREAKAFGWIIPSLRKPALDPFQVPVKSWLWGWVLLPADGGPYIPLSEDVAVARLVRWDMRDLVPGDRASALLKALVGS